MGGGGWGGGHGTGTVRRLGGKKEVRVEGDQRVEGERGDHKNTLLLVGRVLVQVRLYGERGREGGADRYWHNDHRRGVMSVYYSSSSAWVRLLVCIRIEDLTIIGRGVVSYLPPPTPKPSNTSRVGRLGKTFKHRDDGKAPRGSMTSASSQLEG